MKVILESIGGTQFPVEVGDSVTLQELKEKVQETLDIPIARQILSFNGNILREDTDLVDVKHGSVIKFRIIPAPDPDPDPAAEPEAEVIDLQLDISQFEKITVKMRGGDTVYELKEKIQNKEGTPADQMVLTADCGKTEIPDYKRLRDCDLNYGLVSLGFLPVPRPKRSRLPMMSSSSSRPAVDDVDKLSLELQFKGEKLGPPVEVRKWEEVKELRTKLDAMEFKVPGNRAYCFFHGQKPAEKLLDERRSFASQKIAHGDVIEVFSPGYGFFLSNVS